MRQYKDRTGQEYAEKSLTIGRNRWANPEDLWECQFCHKSDLRLKHMTFLSYNFDHDWLCFCNEMCKNCYILKEMTK